MAGTIVTSVINNDTGLFQTNNAYQGIAKAWIKFDGSAVTVTNAFNVSSITRNSTGNFTTSFTPNNCYAMLSGGTASNSGFTGTVHFQYIDSPSSTSSLTYQIYVAKPSGTSNAIYINPVSLSGTSAAGGSSSITVLEISGS